MKIIKAKYFDIINIFRLFLFLFYGVLFCKFIIIAYIIGFTVKNTIHVKIIDIINGFRVFKEYFHFVLF